MGHLLDEEAHQFGGVETQVESAEGFAQFEVSLAQFPLGQGSHVGVGAIGEQGNADIEEVDASAELSCSGLGFAMSAFGDNADDAVVFPEEGEDLGGFTVLDLSQTDAAIADEWHGDNYTKAVAAFIRYGCRVGEV